MTIAVVAMASFAIYLDWPECNPAGLTREAVRADARLDLLGGNCPHDDGEPLPLRGSAAAGRANEVLVWLPWRLRMECLAYEAMRWLRGTA